MKQKHEWVDDDGGLVILERGEDGIYGMTYQYPDGSQFPTAAEMHDWLPEMLRLAARVKDLEAAIALAEEGSR